MHAGSSSRAGEAELETLTGRYALPDKAPAQLRSLAALVATDPLAPTSTRVPRAVVHDHLADSLVALELPEMRAASAIADIGSGAGFPGLPLAIALPHARVWLIESRAPKASFLSLAAVSCGISNVEVVHRRVEECRNLTESFDVVVARALGPLDVVAEYAAPLMEVGGMLVVWRGGRDAAADDDAARAGRLLGLEESRSIPVKPYEEVRDRSLYLMRKLRPTPDRFPRRPGVARRRPLGRERQSA